MAIKIHQAKTRDALAARPGPYWAAPLSDGLYLGYRKLKDGTGTWIARWRDDDGQQHYHALGRASAAFDYNAARERALAWQTQAEAGVDAGEVVTVLDACNAYVKWLEQDRGRKNPERTATDARKRVARYIKPLPIAPIKLAKLRTVHIEDWRNTVATMGRAGTLAPATQNRLLTTLKAALNLAVKRRHLSPTAAAEWRDVAALEGVGKRDLFLDLAQRRALLAELSGGIRDLADATTLIGARPGELVTARRSQFDARTCSLTLHGKTGTRTVRLAPIAVALFARLARDKLPAAPLFTRDDGMPWVRRGDWAAQINAAVARAKLPSETCLYTLRHSFITEALMAGLSTLEVAKFTGTSLEMIQKHYGHLVPDTTASRLAAVNFT